MLAFYTLAFCALTWPAILHIRTHLFMDNADGLQMYWNIWWVRHALLEAHCSPFTTDLLLYPESPNLMLHTLHPFGGLLSIPFRLVLNEAASFNMVVLFGFVVSGYGAYLLAKEIVGGVLPGLVAGYLFTFCGYHFAHGGCHMNLTLTQWIPFYFLALYRLLTRDRLRDAWAAAAFLFLVLLCDHYYFLFSVMATVVFFLWALHHRTMLLPAKRTALRLAAFAAASLLTSGVFVALFLKAAAMDETVAGHDPARYGMDLFALLIPGGHWRFHALTAPYWEHLPGNIHESSVQVGLAALALAAFGWYALGKRREKAHELFLLLFVCFFALSLGRDLHAFGRWFRWPMPYDLLECLAPMVATGGIPVRFIIVATLALAVLAAAGVRALSTTPMRRTALGILLALMVVELLPRPIPCTPVECPDHIQFLARRARTAPGPVLDLVATPAQAMLEQTFHHQPIQKGYVARQQKQVRDRAREVQQMVDYGQFTGLRRQFGFRYVLAREPIPGAELLFPGEIQVYELRDTR